MNEQNCPGRRLQKREDLLYVFGRRLLSERCHFSDNVYQISYFDETTCRLLVTEKVPGTPLARSPAMFLSASLSTTPSRVT
jgi:hypothetical protein